MGVKIDLLPLESKIKDSYIKASRTAVGSTVVVFTILVLSAVGFLAYTFILNSQIQTKVDIVNRLSQEVQNLQSSEQKIVLLKDRLSKILSVSKIQDSYDLYKIVNNDLILQNPNMTVTQANIDESSVNLTLLFKETALLSNFMVSIEQLKFSNVSMSNLNYNPTVGYTATIKITK